MILITLVELYEVATPSPHAHDEVAVQLGVSLRIEQSVAIEGVELKLVATQADVGANELSQLLDTLLVADKALVELDGERTAIDGILEIWLRE